jgi:hypothetical protein
VPPKRSAPASSSTSAIVKHIGALPVDIEALDLSATIPIGGLISEAIDWRIAQAVAAALPGAMYPEGRVVLSVQPARYQATPVRPIDPGPIDWTPTPATLLAARSVSI